MAQGRRRHLVETAIVVVLAAIGIAIFAIGDQSVARDVIGTAIASCAGVLAVSLAFYEVGRGEDEARAAGWRGPYDREPTEPAAPEPHRPPPHEDPVRPRHRALPRRRGDG